MRGQRIGQVDTTDLGQFVAGEPIKELRRTGAFDHMFGKRSRVDQANAFADRFCFVYGVLPPAATAEGARFLVEVFWRIQWAEVVRTLPSVDPAELRAARLLTVVSRCGAQRTAGFTLFIWVVQDIDVLITFLVLTRRKLGGHPVLAVAFWVE